MASSRPPFFDEDVEDFIEDNLVGRQNSQTDSDYSDEEEPYSNDELDEYADLESLQQHRQRRSGNRPSEVGEVGSSRRAPSKTAQVIQMHTQFVFMDF